MPYKDIEKGREHQKQYNLKNRDLILKIKKKSYRKHREEILKKQKEDYYKDINKIREIKRRSYHKHKDKAKVYRIKNKDKIKLYNKEYRKKHDILPEVKLRKKLYHKEYQKRPEAKILMKASIHRRLARLKYKIGNLTAEQVKQIFDRDEVCIYCGSDKKLCLDHIIAISKENGNSIFHNFVVACRYCNTSKGDKDVFLWCNKKGIKIPNIIIENLNKLFIELNKQRCLI